jgi:hypothetical protein
MRADTKRKQKTEKAERRREIIEEAARGVTCRSKLAAIEDAAAVVDAIKTRNLQRAMTGLKSLRRFIKKRLRLLDAVDNYWIKGVECQDGCCRGISGHPRGEARDGYHGKGHDRAVLIEYIRSCYTKASGSLRHKEYAEHAEALLQCAVHHAYRPLRLGGDLKKCGARGICTHCSMTYRTRMLNSMDRMMTSDRKFFLVTLTLPAIVGCSDTEAYSILREGLLAIKRSYTARSEEMRTNNDKHLLSTYMDGYVAGIHPRKEKSKSLDYHAHMIVAMPADESQLIADGAQTLCEMIGSTWRLFTCRYYEESSSLHSVAIKEIHPNKKVKNQKTLRLSLMNSIGYLMKMFPERHFRSAYARNRFLKGKHLIERFGCFKHVKRANRLIVKAARVGSSLRA